MRGASCGQRLLRVRGVLRQRVPCEGLCVSTHAQGEVWGQVRRATWDGMNQEAGAPDASEADDTIDVGVGVVVPSSQGQLMQGGKVRLRLAVRLHSGLDEASEDNRADLQLSMRSKGGDDTSAWTLMRLAMPLLQVEVAALSFAA